MKIEPNLDLKHIFLSALKEKYSRPDREGIHVSNLVYCLREAYWNKVDPAPPTEKTLSFFVDGARRHSVLESLSGARSEVKVERWGIHGTVDMLINGPVEVKTTRAKSGIPDHYLKQLGYYAALMGVNRGYLIIQRLTAPNPWEFYTVEWTPEEMQALAEDMRKKAKLLQQALKNRTPEILPDPGRDTAWKCRNCLYKKRCRGIRGERG